MLHCALLFLVVLFPIADLLSSAVYAVSGSSATIYLRYFRDVITVVLALVALNSRITPASLRWSFIAYSVLVAMYSLVSLVNGVGLGLIAASSATLMLPFLLTFAAIAGIRTLAHFRNVMVVLTSYLFVNAIFGVWELNNTDFWISEVRYGDYLRDVKGILTGFNSETGLPWNFTGYMGVRRAAGIIAAPLANGFFSAVVAFLALYYFQGVWRSWGVLVAILGFFSVYLSETRGAMLVLAIAFATLVLIHIKNPRRLLASLIVILVVVAFSFDILANIIYYSVNFLDGSTLGHVNAFYLNLRELPGVAVFGKGVGYAGAKASELGIDIIGGGEGAFFSIAIQLGLPAAAIFFYFYSLLIKNLFNQSMRFREHQAILQACLVLLVGALSSVVLSEHILTYSGMAALWFTAGGLCAVFWRQAYALPIAPADINPQMAEN